MTDETVIGMICYKGNHIALKGEVDYGCCGGHYYAEIRLSVVPLQDNPRGEETPSAKPVAQELEGIVGREQAYRDAEEWARYEASIEGDI